MGEATLSAKMQAEEIQSTLDPSIPSLIIVMLKSQVGGGFWLGVPSKFARAFMSKDRIVMTLEDQNGKNYEVTYIPAGLSGGWKRFAVDHKLRVGDAVLFQLVDLIKFKVFIVKGNGVADTDSGEDIDGIEDIDAALSRLQLKAQAQRSTQGDAGKTLKPEGKPAAKRRRLAPSAVVRDENGSQQQPDDDNGDVVDSVVGDFESFTKIVNDLVGDSEMPEDVMAKYYELCCTRNSFLHTNIRPGHNSNLAAGMIIETVQIVYGIIVEKQIGSLEKLGMSVDFVFPRLNELQKLSERAVRRLPYQQIYQE
ncbi:hypothetical protein MKW98_011988 [Papaver atlanticum]|uniref:TF-B3 domain-containing protein n=1 Tax=Papaver atlanticum TaxID=357466 RepID=A0AAD4XJ13_9MAGN|nr:hypothetical protein MKW98_011988 [Papaver atlanticum]